MKQWKFLLSSALAIGGMALYHTNVYSSSKAFTKVAVTPETGDLTAMEQIALGGSDAEENYFTLVDNKLKTDEDAGWLKKKDLHLTQGNAELQNILEKNKNFFRGANEFSHYVTDEEYVINFYTVYKDISSSVYANIFNRETSEVNAIKLFQLEKGYENVKDAFIEDHFAYVATISYVYDPSSNSDQQYLVTRKIDLKTQESEIINETRLKSYVTSTEMGTEFEENSPYLLLREESENIGTYTVQFIDMRTGEAVASEEHTEGETAPYYVRNDENIYRFYVTGTLDDITIQAEQAVFDDNGVSFKELSTLEQVPFNLKLEDFMDPVLYDGDMKMDEEPLAYYLFAAYDPTIIDGRLYLIPTTLKHKDDSDKYYVFDLESGELNASGSFDIQLKDGDNQVHIFQVNELDS